MRATLTISLRPARAKTSLDRQRELFLYGHLLRAFGCGIFPRTRAVEQAAVGPRTL
jgi:hypothetical protein